LRFLFYSIILLLFPDQEVAEAILSIRTETIELDYVSLKFVKLLVPSLIPNNFFNICFSRDSFAVDWKVGKILPLPKISNQSDFLLFYHVY
jgi:hypothetical protein